MTLAFVAPHHQPRKRRRPRQRRGVAILVVLSLISISLALSYAMLRAQATSLRIQENFGRLANARSAALSGLTAGIGQMHQPDWKGLSVPITGNLADGSSYTVTFSQGDLRLTAGHPEYSDLPYRVTVTATGYASDPAATGQISLHRIQAVVRLRPERLSESPSGWTKTKRYTVYQWPGSNFVVQTPARIEGPVFMTGELTLCSSYPSDSAARQQYLSDLELIRQASRTDYRPFSGPIRWDKQRNSGSSVAVSEWLGVADEAIQSSDVGQWSAPEKFGKYQLYAGGPEYEIPRLGEVLSNIVLQPDPGTNPLGIFYRSGGLELESNVTIEGSLIATGDIRFAGTDIELKAARFEPIEGSDRLPRFPALCSGGTIRFENSARASIDGVVWAVGEFRVDDGPESAKLTIEGRLVAKDFSIRGRWPWYYSTDVWRSLHQQFQLQQASAGSNRIEYFPDYLAAVLGRSSKPRIVIKPADGPTWDHWQAASGPVYLPLTAGEGLKWDILDWDDDFEAR